jgi:neutral ceramidase
MRTSKSFRAGLGALIALVVFPAAAHAAPLRAGVGMADITPQTGYYLGGWTRADRTSHGQQTRLHSRALVLQEGDRKVALVQVDLFMIPAGMQKQVAALNASRGFREENVLISASHTHSGPGGYANFKTFNTAAPSLQTATDPISFYRLLDPKPADPQLYTFLTKQIAAAVQRADQDLGPASAGWGSAEIEGLTQNRSIEAHLADHGILLEPGQGRASQDPLGIAHTIDPSVNVLRVDKLRRVKGKLRRVPIGAWSTFANHGTVTKSSFQYYNQDHFASAMQVFEAKVRKAGKAPKRQKVLNVYGNSDEGDQSAGLTRDGPAASDYVGRVEAAAMLRAWRSARGSLQRSPALDSRWTRVCFCGQQTEGGAVANYAMAGFPFLTGSEEERGPLYDVTHHSFEGMRNPLPVPGQGHKEGIPLDANSVPKAVPLMAVRVGSRLIVTQPGEATREVGERLRNEVAGAVAGSGIERVVVSGLADEFIQYITTPEEYDRQHYEGGSTLYGPLEGNFLRQQQAALARTLAGGHPAPQPYPFDPTNGVQPSAPDYGNGAASATKAHLEHTRVRRLAKARFSWNGGTLGLDRPVDRAFVTAQRRVRKRWRTVATDLGLQMLWSVDGDGNYIARWELPRSQKAGIYRLVVTAKRYRLVSPRFRVLRNRQLKLRRVAAPAGRVAVRLDYPPVVRDRDLIYRPQMVQGGAVRFKLNGRSKLVRSKRGGVFSVRARRGVRIVAVRGRDRYGNVSAAGVTLIR